MSVFQERDRVFELLLGEIEIPEGAYEKAASRYQDIGTWLQREEAESSGHDPHVFPQGSFRLGTAIRPLDPSDDYDLDLACELRTGVTASSHSQKALKDLVGRDLRAYRTARGIAAPLEPKHRCWRLEYADDLSFHMDIVPCVPDETQRRRNLAAALTRDFGEQALAEAVAELAVSITDDRMPTYSQVASDWPVSNPAGYARWFEFRMKTAETYLAERAALEKAATIDDLPAFKWKSPLQRCVQVLKRHRDQMFHHDPLEGKPISIIITTLAARAYHGEVGLVEALGGILDRMEGYVNSESPRVPNPVNPAEDFADKWATPEGRKSNLEGNFRNWVEQARADFRVLTTSPDPGLIAEKCQRSFACRVDEGAVRNLVSVGAPAVVIPKSSPETIKSPARPWRRLIV